MSKWIIKKIKNKNSDYDFRLLSKNNDYSDVNFFKYSFFSQLTSQFLDERLVTSLGFRTDFNKDWFFLASLSIL